MPAAKPRPRTTALVAASPVQIYLSELSPGSKRTMTFALRTAATFLADTEDVERFPWHKLKVEQMAALRADLASRLAPNTANKILAAVRGVLKASWRMGRLSAEDLYRCTDVRPVKGGPRERGRSLSRTELKALFGACGDGAGGARDAAALACMYGCRRSEPVALDLCDYDPVTGRLMARLPDHQWQLLLGLARCGGLQVPSETHRLEWAHVDWERARLTVFAPKTGATRVVPIVPRLMELLKIAHQQREPGFEQMLLLTENNLHRTVHRAIAAAGLESWPDLFQNLRRNAETDFAPSGSPAHAVAAFMGHSVAVSRRHYLQVTDAMLDAAAGLNQHSALQNALQHRHASGRTGAQKAKPEERDGSADAA